MKNNKRFLSYFNYRNLLCSLFILHSSLFIASQSDAAVVAQNAPTPAMRPASMRGATSVVAIAPVATTETIAADAITNAIVENKSAQFDAALSNVATAADTSVAAMSDAVARARNQVAATEAATLKTTATAARAGRNLCDTALRECMYADCGTDFSLCAKMGDTEFGNKLNTCRRNAQCTGAEFNMFTAEIKADRTTNADIAAYTNVINCGDRYNGCIFAECGTMLENCLGQATQRAAMSKCAPIATECNAADSGLGTRMTSVFGTLRQNAELGVARDEQRLRDLRVAMAAQCQSLGGMLDERSLDCVYTASFFADGTLFASKKLYAGNTFDCTPDWFGVDVSTYIENALRLTASSTTASSALMGAGLGVGVGAITSGMVSRAIETQRAEKAVEKAADKKNCESASDAKWNAKDEECVCNNTSLKWDDGAMKCVEKGFIGRGIDSVKAALVGGATPAAQNAESDATPDSQQDEEDASPKESPKPEEEPPKTFEKLCTDTGGEWNTGCTCPKGKKLSKKDGCTDKSDAELCKDAGGEMKGKLRFRKCDCGKDKQFDAVYNECKDAPAAESPAGDASPPPQKKNDDDGIKTESGADNSPKSNAASAENCVIKNFIKDTHCPDMKSGKISFHDICVPAGTMVEKFQREINNACDEYFKSIVPAVIVPRISADYAKVSSNTASDPNIRDRIAKDDAARAAAADAELKQKQAAEKAQAEKAAEEKRTLEIAAANKNVKPSDDEGGKKSWFKCIDSINNCKEYPDKCDGCSDTLIAARNKFKSDRAVAQQRAVQSRQTAQNNPPEAKVQDNPSSAVRYYTALDDQNCKPSSGKLACDDRTSSNKCATNPDEAIRKCHERQNIFKQSDGKIDRSGAKSCPNKLQDVGELRCEWNEAKTKSARPDGMASDKFRAGGSVYNKYIGKCENDENDFPPLYAAAGIEYTTAIREKYISKCILAECATNPKDCAKL